MKKIILITAFLSLALSKVKAQDHSVGVNIPSLLFGNLNADLSLRLTDRVSFQLQGQVNPFDFKVPAPIGLIHLNTNLVIDRRIFDIGWVQHTFNVTLQPGVRLWQNGVYNRGFFLQANFVASMYKLGGDVNDKTYRKGYSIGAAASAGYSYELSTFWNLEAELGLGMFYNKYHNISKEVKDKGFFNGDLSDVTIFPNIIAIKLVYLF